MATVLRNALAVALGLAVGAGVNMALVVLGPYVIAPPPGVDVSDSQSLAASMHLFGPRHFVFPFLAHALGTLVGAFTAFLAAATRRAALAGAIGVAFFAGGVAATFMIPAPIWFVALDLVGAYLPMAWLGALLGRRVAGRSARVAAPPQS